MVLPESPEDVDANVWLLSVTYAAAERGENPVNATLADCVDDPLFVNTTTTEPSVFWNAPIITLDMDPEVATLKAPGRIYLDHMANAQKIPDGVAVCLSSASIKWLPDWDC